MIKEETVRKISTELLKNITVNLADDAVRLIKKAMERERNPIAREGLKNIMKNYTIAASKCCPLCQSPGTLMAYIRLGTKIQIEGSISRALKQAVETVTKEGYIRPSMVHPITRANPGTNVGRDTPSMDIELLPDADYMELILHMKGSEETTTAAMKIFTPADIGPDGEGIQEYVLEIIMSSMGGSCPPGCVGVGMGGAIETAARLSRKCLIRSWDKRHEDPDIAELEKKLLAYVNKLGIGPNWLGGDITTLAVNVEYAYTHTANLPVVVNIHCWNLRRGGVRIYKDESVEPIKF